LTLRVRFQTNARKQTHIIFNFPSGLRLGLGSTVLVVQFPDQSGLLNASVSSLFTRCPWLPVAAVASGPVSTYAAHSQDLSLALSSCVSMCTGHQKDEAIAACSLVFSSCSALGMGNK
jgi:hypothetical protein